ncbi:hypothetical protein, partial [Prescottella equi]|uniref:hypothetical protein n=1 Tax=Rhodococcus hoagii TaxID=43767 RepID=UPI001C92BF24
MGKAWGEEVEVVGEMGRGRWVKGVKMMWGKVWGGKKWGWRLVGRVMGWEWWMRLGGVVGEEVGWELGGRGKGVVVREGKVG